MSEEQVYKLMMIAGMVLAVIAGIGTVALLVQTAQDYSFSGLVISLVMAGVSVGSGVAGVHFAQRAEGHMKVFRNVAEREVLTNKQRRDLKRARAEVVMEGALIEVEHERQNLVHKQIEAAHDPDKPPHETQWNVQDTRPKKKQLSDPDDPDVYDRPLYRDGY